LFARSPCAPHMGTLARHAEFTSGLVVESTMILSACPGRAGDVPPVGRRLKRNVVICAAVVACAIGGGSSAVFGESNPVDNQSTPANSSRPAANLPARSQGHVPQGETGPLETGSGGAPAASPQGETPPACRRRLQDPKAARRQKIRALPTRARRLRAKAMFISRRCACALPRS